MKLSYVWVGVGALLIGCGGTPYMGTMQPPPTPYAVTATIDTTTHHQTLEGFGAAVAFETSYLAARNLPNDDIYNVLFIDLGLDILRLGNWYQNQSNSGSSATAFGGVDNDNVTFVQKATAALGHPPKILMSSWSPPAYLKNNAVVTASEQANNTLLNTNGAFEYAAFGQWWVDSLAAYAAHGVVPDYISIQNEPDFWNAGWQTCFFDSSENAKGTGNAGYDKALGAVRDAMVASSGQQPMLLGPETSGIGSSKVQGYMNALQASGLTDALGGVAHHLYNGGNSTNPPSFSASMDGVAAAGGGKPLFMTEYSPNTPTLMGTAWLIQQGLTVEGLSAYFYWELTWAAPSSGVPTALVTLEPPWAMSTWTTAKGYIINDIYYAVKHFSKWTDPGWQRVESTGGAAPIRTAAFVSPDGGSLTVVILNTDYLDHGVTIDVGAFSAATTAVYRTSGANERTAAVGPLGSDNTVVMPAQSVVTVTFTP
jgi:glucuronoarabinoxylan endo-1,4-beta-xylanase